MKISFAIKWFATGILSLAAVVNGLGYYPDGPLLIALGSLLWAVAAYLDRDWTLFVPSILIAVITAVVVGFAMQSLDDLPEGAVKADEYWENMKPEAEPKEPIEPKRLTL